MSSGQFLSVIELTMLLYYSSLAIPQAVVETFSFLPTRGTPARSMSSSSSDMSSADGRMHGGRGGPAFRPTASIEALMNGPSPPVTASTLVLH